MRLAAIAVALCAFIAGCERTPQTKKQTETHTQTAVATRVVSLLPTVTDLIVAMRQQDKLIARSDYDTDPSIAHLPSIGGGLTPSVEWLASQKPDAVISWPDRGSRSLVIQLQGVGIRVYGVATDTIADTYRAITFLGGLLGAQHAADSLLHSMQSHLDSVRAFNATLKRVRVAYVVSVSPATVVGPHTFIDELINIAGGENVFADFNKQYAEASLEEIIRRDPDIIIVAREEPFDANVELSKLPGWRDLRAVKTKHAHHVDADQFNRSGPLMPQAARTLSDLFAGAR